MTISEANFGLRAEQIAQEAAQRRRLKDAKQQRSTIVGDEDGHWLQKALQGARSKGATARLTKGRRFRFQGDTAEEVLNSRGDQFSGTEIDMPEGSVIRKIDGTGYGSWVFRVENGQVGAAYEHIDLAYRKVESFYLLYLKSHQRGERRCSGRRAGVRTMGRGPDYSL